MKEVLAFDRTQVTSKLNYSHPKWGDPCHPIARGAEPPIVIIRGGEVLIKCVGNGQLDQARLSDKVGALNCMHDQQAIIRKDDTMRSEVLVVECSEQQEHLAPERIREATTDRTHTTIC